MKVTSVGHCCYVGCTNSYSTDKDITFFKFPDDPTRRSKWIVNCGNMELKKLADRQLRGKRVCAAHFSPNAFSTTEARNALKDTAVPISCNTTAGKSPAPSPKVVGSRGRPSSQRPNAVFILPDIKQEPIDIEEVQIKLEANESFVPSLSGRRTRSLKAQVVEDADKNDTTLQTKSNVKEELPSKRGRPKKQTVVEEVKEVEVIKKRVVLEEEVIGKASKSPLLEGVKARGRPKKTPVLDEIKAGKRPDKIPKPEEVKTSETPKKTSVSEEAKVSGKPKTPVLELVKTSGKSKRTLPEEVIKSNKRAKIETAHVAKLGKNNENTIPTLSKVSETKKLKLEPKKELQIKLQRIECPKKPVPELIDIDSNSESSGEENESGEEVDSCEDDRIPEENSAVTQSPQPDGREFERFHSMLRKNCNVPPLWSLGGVLWDPWKKMKVITASEMDLTTSGTVRIKRCVQIFETMTVKVLIDGFDLSNRYEVKSVTEACDVNRLLQRVAVSKLCCGVKNVAAEDAILFPEAVPRGSQYYSEECPVVMNKKYVGPLCTTCHKLRNAIRRRKRDEKQAMVNRKASRPTLKSVNSPFGKALYTLLTDLMSDGEGVKSSRKKKRINMLYSRGHNICVRSEKPDIKKDDKPIQDRAKNSSSISNIMQNIVSKMTLTKSRTEGGSVQSTTKNTNGVQTGDPSKHSALVPVDEEKEPEILSPPTVTETVAVESDSGNVSVPNALDFTLTEGQEYELIGEVDPSEVQVVEMMKETPQNQTIEIIEVDDQTMAQLTAQNMGGVFLQDSSGPIQVTEIDANDPSLGHILKAINPSQAF